MESKRQVRGRLARIREGSAAKEDERAIEAELAEAPARLAREAQRVERKVRAKRIARDLVLKAKKPYANYARNQIVHAAEVVTVRTLEDAERAIAAAAHAGQSVRAVGAGHSSSDVLQTAGVLIKTRKLRGPLPIDPSTLRDGIDPDRCAEFLGGTSIRRINRYLWKHRRAALANMGSYDAQTIAGATATGTHGSGIGLGSLSDAVTSIVILTADGRRLRIEPKDGPTRADRHAEPGVELIQDDAWFYSSVVNLGALGFTYAVRVAIEPRYRLGETRTLSRWSEVKKLLAEPDFLTSDRHIQILLNPHVDGDGEHTAIITRRSVVTGGKKGKRGGRPWLPEKLAGITGADTLISSILRKVPGMARRALDWSLEGLAYDEPYVDRSYRVLHLGDVNEQEAVACELSFPLQRVVSAVESIFALAQERIDANGSVHTSPFALRFVAGGAHSIAMNEGSDPHCFIEIPMLEGTKHGFELLELHQARLLALGGRPHWGQLNGAATSADAVRDRYPRADEFRQLRAELDPHGRFESVLVGRAGL